MSGSGEYTTTPNLGLFKPTYNADAENWGFHINSNSDVLDAAFGGSAVGPFLPLAGGVVTGQTEFVGTADATHPFLYAHHNVGGTATPGQEANWFAFNIDNDNADATGAGGGGATGAYFGHNVIAGAKGGRTGLNVLLTQSGDTTSAGGTYYVALGAFSQSNHSAGGTAGAPLGALFGINTAATIATGSGDNWFSAVGMEVDVAVQAGATAAYKSGISIVQWNNDQVRGTLDDFALGISGQGMAPVSPGWKTGIQFGQASGWWSFRDDSTMIGTRSGMGGGPAMRANNGIDFSAVTFVGNAFMSPGFQVAGSGHVRALAGIDFGSQLSAGPQDFAKHINLYGGQFGICIDNAGNTAYTASAGHTFWMGTTQVGYINSTGINAAIGQQAAAAGNFTALTATGATLSGGLKFGAVVVTPPTNLSRHIELYTGYAGFSVSSSAFNYVLNDPAAAHYFYVNSVAVAYISSAGFNGPLGQGAPSPATVAYVMLGTGGPTWTTGSAVPSSPQPVGSLYSRVGGAVGATLYVSRGAGTWAAVAGV